MARTKKNNGAAGAPLTTAQALGTLLKSARDIMRKDKGLNGDLDRLPLLTWIMFLKFLDDLEQQREQAAKLAGKKFRPAIDKPYRWRDWASNAQGITGDELLSFINQDEAVRPDGTRGAGLFAHLRSLTSSNGDNRRDVIATVFKGVDNRMKSGYLLRDVINKVAGIHFTSSEELNTLGALYESMLREMRDAAGDSGEFYTPRPVVRFMVQVTDPQLSETVLDPASGTGGFLVEAFAHLSKQVQKVADRKLLQEKTILGYEPKPLPYLLGQMNLLLHGLDAPQIDPGNALRFKLSEIGEKDRVDVILTNPPFGGEEEKGIQGNFPEDRQTAETALLFLQLIMRKLRRQQTIFFDRSGPTKNVWYFEQPLPEGRKNYTKTQPLQFDEFSACLKWWNNRRENDQAWKITAKSLLENGCNLDQKNPRGKIDFAHLPPDQLADDILKKELRIAELMREIKTSLGART